MPGNLFTSSQVVQELKRNRGGSECNKTAKNHDKNAMALPLPRVLRTFRSVPAATA
jgi:hypothetical protein